MRSALVGRERDVAEVWSHLERPGVVVVTGPPGIGKSRLVVAIAERWATRAEVVACELADVASPGAEPSAQAVVTAVAVALGIAATPPAAGDAEATVAAALAARPGALLVLDEADAAAPVLGGLLDRWCAAAPGLRCLVASRVRVDALGAEVRSLGPLDAESARALYVERAQAVFPGVASPPEAVDALVAALDGVPLALELAAARIRVFPPAALIGRLPAGLVDAKRTGRHGSLVAALTASWELLDPPCRGALAAASVLRGVFGVDGFEAVSGRPPEVLEALLDASLVQLAGPGRMRLLDTVRTFADDHLGEPERTEVLARHAAWVVAAGSAAVKRARRGGPWLDVEALRADLAAAAGRGSAEAALLHAELGYVRGPIVDPGPLAVGPELRVAAGCLRARILGRSGRHAAALEVVDGVIAALAAPDADPAHRLEASTVRLLELTQLNRLDDAEREADVALGLARGADPRPAAEARIAVAILADRRGHGERAVALLEEASAAVVGAEDREIEARVLGHLGIMLRERAYGAAAAHLRRAAELYHGLGDEGWEGVVYGWLGVHALDGGDLELATEALVRAAGLCARAGDVLSAAKSDLYRMSVELEQRRFDDAERTGAAILAAPIAVPWMRASVRGRLGQLAVLRGEPSVAARALDEAIGAFRELGLVRMPALYLPFLAVACAGDPHRAASVLAEAEREAAEVGGGYPALVGLARAVIDGTPPSDALRTALGGRPGHTERLLLSLCDAGLRVASDGSWFEAPGQPRVDLAGRPVLRRLLATLAERPGRAVGRVALVDATWPGERMRADSAAARLHAAVRTLRKLGLGDALVTTDTDGDLAYALDARVQAAGGPITARD